MELRILPVWFLYILYEIQVPIKDTPVWNSDLVSDHTQAVKCVRRITLLVASSDRLAVDKFYHGNNGPFRIYLPLILVGSVLWTFLDTRKAPNSWKEIIQEKIVLFYRNQDHPIFPKRYCLSIINTLSVVMPTKLELIRDLSKKLKIQRQKCIFLSFHIATEDLSPTTDPLNARHGWNNMLQIRVLKCLPSIKLCFSESAGRLMSWCSIREHNTSVSACLVSRCQAESRLELVISWLTLRSTVWVIPLMFQYTCPWVQYY